MTDKYTHTYNNNNNRILKSHYIGTTHNIHSSYYMYTYVLVTYLYINGTYMMYCIIHIYICLTYPYHMIAHTATAHLALTWHTSYIYTYDIYTYDIYIITLYLFIGIYIASFFEATRHLGQNYDPFIFHRLIGSRLFYVK